MPQACACARGVPKSGTTVLQAVLAELSRTGEAGGRTARLLECSRKHQHSISATDDSGAPLRYVSIYRDPRDVAVSTFHWKPSGFDSIDEFVMDSTVGLEHIVDLQNKHVEEERIASKRRAVPILRIFYESLREDAHATIRAIATHAGVRGLSEQQVSAIAERTSFDSMRQQEAAGRMVLRQHPDSSARLANRSAADLDPARLFGVMTRRGQAGSWRLELNRSTQAYGRAVVRVRSCPLLRWRYAVAVDA
jgi:hypothetical protein